MEQAVSNAAGALDGLRALEDDAIAAHKRVADALEGCRALLLGVIVERYGKTYQITGLRAYRGIVNTSGVRYYPHDKMAGSRQYDLGDFRGCKVLKYPDQGDAPIKPTTPQRARYNWPKDNHATK